MFFTLLFRLNGQVQPDASFGTNGFVNTSIYSEDEETWKVSVDSVGRIYLAGYVKHRDKYDERPYVARFKADGQTDSTFGNSGIVIFSFLGQINDLQFTSDGILFYGKIDNDLLLGKLSFSGTLDKNFGSNGYIRISRSRDHVPASILTRDDDIIVGAYLLSEDSSKIGLFGFDKDGSVDLAFGTNGYAIGSVSGSPFELSSSMKAQSDGKIVSGGMVFSGAGFVNMEAFIVRYTSNGSVDLSFGNNGYSTIKIGNRGNSQIKDVAIQSDDKIVVTGYTYESNTVNRMFVARLEKDGQIDETFANSGISILDIGSASLAFSVAIQSDGKIIIGGSSAVGAPSFQTYSALARFLPDGEKDDSFGDDGILISCIPGMETNNCFSIAIQPDLKILSVGSIRTAIGYFDSNIWRFNNNDHVNIEELTSSFGIHPNPAKGVLNFKAEKSVENIIISDLSGRMIMNHKVSANEGQADISTLISGVYFVTLQAYSGQKTIKIIVE